MNNGAHVSAFYGTSQITGGAVEAGPDYDLLALQEIENFYEKKVFNDKF
ncbi:hypothetical protein V5K00_RS22315 [Enterobacter asburiae]